MTTVPRSLMILVAGPYRSGTSDDPRALEANVRAMQQAALVLFRAGHLPVTGEALALPLRRSPADRRPLRGSGPDGCAGSHAGQGRLHQHRQRSGRPVTRASTPSTDADAPASTSTAAT